MSEKNNKPKLKIAQTKIGERKGKVKQAGIAAVITVYYGNYTLPPINGEYYQLTLDSYNNMLDEFLDSPEGKKYQRPTQSERDEALVTVANFLEKEKKKRIQEKQLDEEKQKQSQSFKNEDLVKIDPDIADIRDNGEEDEKEKPISKKKEKIELDELTKMYKRQANILTVAVIFLVLVMVIQMLLNLYLFTR